MATGVFYRSIFTAIILITQTILIALRADPSALLARTHWPWPAVFAPAWLLAFVCFTFLYCLLKNKFNLQNLVLIRFWDLYLTSFVRMLSEYRVLLRYYVIRISIVVHKYV